MSWETILHVWESHAQGDSLFQPVALQSKCCPYAPTLSGSESTWFVNGQRGGGWLYRWGGWKPWEGVGKSKGEKRLALKMPVLYLLRMRRTVSAHPLLIYFFFFLEKSYIAAKVLRQYCKVRRETNSWIPLSRERYGCFALFDPSRNAGPPESLMAQMSPAQCHWMTT